MTSESNKQPSTGTIVTNTDERVSTEQLPTTSDLFRVGVKIPPFWPEKPHIWFSQIEGQFAMARITDDTTKFYHVLAHLDRQYSIEVEDIITTPPSSNKYDKLKNELIKRLSMSSEKKVKQLLQSEEMGDRNPSQFLRHLRHLAGPTIPNDFLRTVWSSRLPENLQTIVASQAHKLPLEELAELADRVHDVVVPSSPQVAAATACSSRYNQPTQGSTLDIMARQIADLTKQVSALTAAVDRARPRTRQTEGRRSRTPSRRSQSNYRKFPLCWYHHKHGERASRCVPPCDYKAGNSRGNQ